MGYAIKLWGWSRFNIRIEDPDYYLDRSAEVCIFEQFHVQLFTFLEDL